MEPSMIAFLMFAFKIVKEVNIHYINFLPSYVRYDVSNIYIKVYTYISFQRLSYYLFEKDLMKE